MDPHSEWAVGQPAPRLRHAVARYVGYRLAGFAPGEHWGVPSRHATFIVSIGDPIDVVTQTDPGQSPARYGVVVGGLQNTSARIAHNGFQEGVAIELEPTGFRGLFGMPIGALWSTSIELSDLVGGCGRELWERLQVAPTWDARFAACDAVLGRIVGEAELAPELTLAWRSLVASDGAVTVAELADATEWSRQHLARRFRAEFGLSPKVAGRVIRFERAYRMLQRTPSFVTIAQIAAVCGYYDQAHLDREFRALTGASPSQLRDDDLPSVQDREVTGYAC
jgi:AraC-like DNA-binding protein